MLVKQLLTTLSLIFVLSVINYSNCDCDIAQVSTTNHILNSGFGTPSIGFSANKQDAPGVVSNWASSRS